MTLLPHWGSEQSEEVWSAYTPERGEALFQGQVALVVSASRGIGYAIAAELARQGASVALTARNEEPLRQAATSLEEATGQRVLAVPAHSRKETDRQEAVEAVMNTFGRLDMLVYTTGANPAQHTLAIDLDLECLLHMFDTNVVGALGFTQLAWQAWMKDHGGAVLMMNTVAATGGVRLSAYSATKAALRRLTEDLADQLAPDVRVNGLAPAFVRTPFMESITTLPQETVAASYPLGRFGETDDIARAAAFLLSPQSSWITGVTLPVDGGKSVAATTHDRPHPVPGQAIH
ncbi:SDR family oxidoreductase [Streptomyces iconiensis]|uniref:SDR family oxidoreductase n=1 Tax=Streptomyces iconiensis TaxID=1384038 RepID=A0ABT7A3B5_9ACTN|nr:SDR family oxidoreductase [Streptomyces iconiensis]MDJ1135133.1 SDR family oxidoreductase [Streptomyces iconiensis]